MSKLEQIDPLGRMINRKKEERGNLCIVSGCDQQRADDIGICEKHKITLQEEFYAQIGLDPLFHMEKNASLFPDWSWIYFVGSREHGIVKIGQTGKLRKRMRQLKNSSPVPIKLLAVVLGRPSLEGFLHDYFKSSRKHGEWFELSEDLNQCIEDIKVQRFGRYIPSDMRPTQRERIERIIRSLAESEIMHASTADLRARIDKATSVDFLRGKK